MAYTSPSIAPSGAVFAQFQADGCNGTMRRRDAIRDIRRLAREMREAASREHADSEAAFEVGARLVVMASALAGELDEPALDRIASNLQIGALHVKANPEVLRGYLTAGADELEAWTAR